MTNEYLNYWLNDGWILQKKLWFVRVSTIVSVYRLKTREREKNEEKFNFYWKFPMKNEKSKNPVIFTWNHYYSTPKHRGCFSSKNPFFSAPLPYHEPLSLSIIVHHMLMRLKKMSYHLFQQQQQQKRERKKLHLIWYWLPISRT